jgi:hypothetical protein
MIPGFLIVAGLTVSLLTAPAPAGNGTGHTTCHHVRGPFSVSHGYMVDGAGKRFTPYGINLTGMDPADYAGSVAQMEAEEDAAAFAWCANLVRFGISQDQMTPAYLSATASVVSHAEDDHLAVVMAMSRGRNSVASEYMPTWKTRLAWRAVYRRFGKDHQVIFELWNEPRHTGWAQWRDGGYFGGIRFYGMEQVAQWLRAMGYRSLLWADGTHSAAHLEEAAAYHLTGVGAVAYSIHHPPPDLAGWNYSFGYLAGHYAVVDGEWTNYSRSDAQWACWNNAPVLVPEFLRYLARRHIGMVAFDLAQPRLIESVNPADPNLMRKDWRCVTGLNEGAGHRIMDWFREHNGWYQKQVLGQGALRGGGGAHIVMP